MAIIDGIFFLILLASMYSGWRKGFVIATLDLFVWVGTLLLVFYLYQFPASFLSQTYPRHEFWIVPVSFLATLLVMKVFADYLLRKALLNIPDEVQTHTFNSILGIFPGLINGYIYIMVLASFLLFTPFFSGPLQGSAITPLLTRNIEWLQVRLSPILDNKINDKLNPISVPAGSHETITLNFKVKDANPRPDLELQMLDLINAERKNNKLPALTFDNDLRPVARLHSQDMLSRGYFSHYTPERKSPFDRVRAAKVPFLISGENLALAQSLKLAHEGLMKSPGHRANILHPSFGRVGIGILDAGFYGLMITQNFRN